MGLHHSPLRRFAFRPLLVSVSRLSPSSTFLLSLFKRSSLETKLAGYPSTLAVILFLGGVQLLSIGIIGEYVGRIFNETKQRPLYLIEEYHNGSTPKKARRKD